MPRPRSELVLHDVSVREEAVILNSSQGRLFGVICEPTGTTRAGDDWVVFLNAATVRRIGSNRLSTVFARAWAQAGVPSLRFDTYGVGDSDGQGLEEEPAVTDYKVLYEPERIAVVNEALEWLSSHRRARRFELIGLSAGGTIGFQAALVEERIAGVALLNPSTLFWDEHAKALESWDEFRRVVRSPRSWPTHFLRRGVRWWVTQAARGAFLSLRGVNDEWQRERILDALDVLAARGASITFVFASPDPGLTYLERHLGAGYLDEIERRGARVELVRGTNHTFRPLWSHDLLRDVLERQLRTIGFFRSRDRTREDVTA